MVTTSSLFLLRSETTRRSWSGSPRTRSRYRTRSITLHKRLVGLMMTIFSFRRLSLIKDCSEELELTAFAPQLDDSNKEASATYHSDRDPSGDLRRSHQVSHLADTVSGTSVIPTPADFIVPQPRGLGMYLGGGPVSGTGDLGVSSLGTHPRGPGHIPGGGHHLQGQGPRLVRRQPTTHQP